ncbi:hypothetical protein BDM02DRAFT_3117588 [Thelephora ganbajun]|uniref:Uncharacterized protein n=1 Tax=Thelephora ganbajun TaxID=370292 RepID=A0ACB6ZC21_THEGA|nr:hypothetical protein BDM02DRAFT_3117588 [Thelephora ganbajun]
MSHYLAFVLLALSASSVFAAPAELPQIPTIPDATTVTRPVFGGRSSDKVYSLNTLRKRDWQYPTSTEDCRLSEVPEDHLTLPYTHEDQEYSEECLTRLALSVPFEDRKSCRTTGPNARGYDGDCLFKKAFDEDWKFDMEKAREDERAWRAANPSRSSSDAWRNQFPTAVSHCLIDIEFLTMREVVGEKGGEKKPVKGGKKKATTMTSDAMNGWSPYSVTHTGETLDNDCLLRLIIGSGIVITPDTCPPDDNLAADEAALTTLLTNLLGNSASATITAFVTALGALDSGCLINIVSAIVTALGMDTDITDDPSALLALITSLLNIL